jgi:hypothetical protein
MERSGEIDGSLGSGEVIDALAEPREVSLQQVILT